jgi:parallel beta-helix repeat protein
MAVSSRYRSAGLSDPGRKRDNNEDRFHADPDRGIFFVIDGVGGHNAGEKAADVALSIMRARLERPTGVAVERIREAITLANNEIYALSHTNAAWAGMACVLTVAVIEGDTVTIGHVGDSRIYLIRDGAIQKLTHDHSPVGEREDSGDIDELAAMRHPRRNEVFRDVGTEEHAPDDQNFIEIAIAGWDRESALVLCSDGLTDLVPSSVLLRIVEAYAGRPEAAVRALVDAANEAGGKDNVTAIVVEGSGFARAVAKPQMYETTRPMEVSSRRSVYGLPLLSILFALALVVAVVWFLKPHWRETAAGRQFGFGVVREPRIIHVNRDIGVAVEQATPGDTVLVAPGRYTEQLRLKDGVTILSERPREAVLQTSGIAITADDVQRARVEGLKIVSDEAQPLMVGVRLIDSDVELSDVEISGAHTAGVEVLGSSAGSLRANTIAGNPGTGIAVRDSARPRVVNNVIAGNGRGSGSGRPGIEISGAAQPVLTGNTLLNNAAEPIFAPQRNIDALLRSNFVIPERRPAASRHR